jgi:hypothetical protein
MATSIEASNGLGNSTASLSEIEADALQKVRTSSLAILLSGRSHNTIGVED